MNNLITQSRKILFYFTIRHIGERRLYFEQINRFIRNPHGNWEGSRLVFICTRWHMILDSRSTSSSSIPFIFFVAFVARSGLPRDLKFLLEQERNDHSRFYDGSSEDGRRTAIKIGHEVCPSSASVTLRRIVTRVSSIPDSSPLSFSSPWFARSDFTIAERAVSVHLSSFLLHMRIIKALGGHTIDRDSGCKISYWFLVTRLISSSPASLDLL